MKEINSFTVLAFTVQVTLSQLQKFVRTKARELYQDAIQHNLEIMGPVYWVYNGMDGNPETVFTLEIALPVVPDENYHGNFAIKKLRAFKCLSQLHKGSWDKLSGTYHSLFLETGKMGLPHSGECREIYIHIDFSDLSNNLTEVQIGLL